MKAVYFGPEWRPTESEFDLYRDATTKSPVTALHDPAYPGSSRLIRHDEYDRVAEAYKKLDPWSRDVMKAQAAFAAPPMPVGQQSPVAKLSDQQRGQFFASLKAVDLNLSDRSLAIVDDQALGAPMRREAVYDVSGRPVPARCMTPVTISFCMGKNMYVARRMLEAFERFPEDKASIARILKREARVTDVQASRAVDAPAARQLARPALTPAG